MIGHGTAKLTPAEHDRPEDRTGRTEVVAHVRMRSAEGAIPLSQNAAMAAVTSAMSTTRRATERRPPGAVSGSDVTGSG